MKQRFKFNICTRMQKIYFLAAGWYLKTLSWFHERFDISLSYLIFWVLRNTLSRCMKQPKKTQEEKLQITFLNLPNKIQTISEFRFVLLTDRDFQLETQRFHSPYSHVGKYILLVLAISRSQGHIKCMITYTYIGNFSC